jgi:hypothetical protein
MTTDVIIETVYDTIVVDDTQETIVVETPGVVTVITTAEQGPPGLAGIQNIEDASDIDSSNKVDGSLLIYSAQNQKWVATTLLENQSVESGHY